MTWFDALARRIRTSSGGGRPSSLGAWWPEVTSRTVRADALAGLLVCVLVLPQGIAFALLAGLPPQVGLYTAIVPCVVAALAGSSRHMVSGPTNALSLATLAMLAPLATPGSTEYLELAFAMALGVGAIQLAVGLLRLGTLANFISPSVLHGFTTGAAVLIVVYALKDVLGIPLAAGLRPGGVLSGLAQAWQQVQPSAVAVAAVTLGVTLASRRLSTRWPAMLTGLLAGWGLSMALAWALPAAAPMDRIGSLPAIWPPFHLPGVDWHRVPDLLGLAAALSIVALGQTLAVAKALAARSGHRLDVNREFAGQGWSNLAGGVFSCYVSCGSLNRSMPNMTAGARTPLAAVFSALWLLLLAAVSAPLLERLPLAAIGALLLIVAAALLDLPRWRDLLRHSRREFLVAAATAVATLVMRLEMAILLGTMLSLVIYLYRTSRPAMRAMGFDSRASDRRLIVLADHPDALPECPQLKMLRMEGSVYFGATAHVADTLHELRAAPHAPRHLLVMAKSMNFVDLAGAELWQAELRSRRAAGGDLYFHRPRPPVLHTWQRIGFTAELGADHVFPDKRTALATIVPRLDRAICDRCTVRLFEECPPPPGPGRA